MKRQLLLLITLQFGILANSHSAGFKGEKAAQVDLSQWQCAFCPFKQAPASVQLDLRHIPKQAKQLRNQLGQQNEINVGLTSDWQQVSSESGNWQAETHQLGFDSFSARASWRGARQQQVSLSYRQLSQNLNSMQASPYSGWSQAQLSLPENWQAFDRQQDFNRSQWNQPQLDGMVWRQLTIDTEWPLTDSLLLSLQWQQQQRQGYRPLTSNQLVQASQLLAKVDENWQQLNLGLEWDASRWDTGIYYQHQRFDNRLSSVQYDYPFAGFGDASFGQTALAPDYQGDSVSGYLHLPGAHGRLYLTAGISQHTQQQTLLPYSTDDTLNAPLPVDTWQAQSQLRWSKLKAQHKLSSQATLHANYQWQARHLEAPEVLWSPLINDLFVAPAKSNPVYDQQFSKFELFIRWRSNTRNQLTTGYRSYHKHWDWSEHSNKAYQQDYFASYHGKIGTASRYDATLVHSEQQAADTAPQAITAAFTQFYSMLSKQSDRLTARIFTPLTSQLTMSLQGFAQDTDFDNQVFGLTSQRSTGFGSTLNWNLTNTMQLDGGINWSRHHNRTLQPGPGSHYQTKDTLRHWHLQWQQDGLLDSKLDWHLRFERNLSKQALDIAMATVSDSWSPYQGSLYSFALGSGYQLNQQQRLQLVLRHDKVYHYSWQQDFNHTNQINDLLALDSSNQAYRITMLQLSWRYQW